MTAKDEQIGRNLVHLRGERPQTEIAEAMRERGYKWSQATVWAVEKGERPLRLTEADDLSQILGGGIGADMFLMASSATELRAALFQVSDAHSHLRKAADAYLAALDTLAQIAHRLSAEGSEYAIPPSMWETVTSWLKEHSTGIDALETDRQHLGLGAKRGNDETAQHEARKFWALAAARDGGSQAPQVIELVKKLADEEKLDGNYSGVRETMRRETETHGVDPEAS